MEAAGGGTRLRGQARYPAEACGLCAIQADANCHNDATESHTFSTPATPAMSIFTAVNCVLQLQAERLLKVQQLAASTLSTPSTPAALLHWYIMTSPFTHADTLSHFEAHSFFGLQPEQVHFFQQGFLPCLTAEGGVMKGKAAAASPSERFAAKPGLHLLNLCFFSQWQIDSQCHRTALAGNSPLLISTAETCACLICIVALSLCVHTLGKVIMETPSRVAKAPDGNGGVYLALQRCEQPAAGCGYFAS